VWLRRAAWVLFFGYVGLLILAGAWAVLFGRADQSLLFGLHLGDVSPRTQANLMSQYRFLRAIEMGFGLFALIYRDAIFQRRAYNRLFLFTMASGVFARIISIALDGSPSWWMYLFGGWELVGVVVIYAYTRKTLQDDA
jgi:Domain of unknown function (DUF4345)